VSLKRRVGCGGAIYIVGRRHPHKFLIAYSLIYMLPLSAKIPFNWRELTPVSVIALDHSCCGTTPRCRTDRENLSRLPESNPPFKMAARAPSARTMSSPSSSRKRTGAKSPTA